MWGDWTMKYTAIFKIQNGECSYIMPIGREAKDKEEAEKIFKEYECNNNQDIWKLKYFEEVKDFEKLWEMIRN